MSQVGGSATINGILYQILGTLEWAARIHLAIKPAGKELLEAQLIIEPEGGGGDARLQSSGQRVVGQWKTRKGHRTWSLQEIIEEVIPDLYLAVRDARLEDKTEYRFITSGRQGKLGAALDFFDELKRDSIPPDPVESLDDVVELQFFPTESCTKRELFLRIADTVRRRQSVRTEPELLTYQKLWHLLARFTFTEGCTVASLQQQINNFLYELVDYAEDVDAKRRELCTVLLELAARGDITISPDGLLRRAGLQANSFRQWAALRTRFRQKLDRTLQREKYEKEKDVRQPPAWPEDASVFVLKGESGQGKTWQLFNLASQLALGDELVVLIKASSDADRDLQAVADAVWKDGLNHDQSLSLDRMVERRRGVVPEIASPWLTVCIDEVRSVSHARRLLEHDWKGGGIQLAMTAPPTVGRVLENDYPESVRLVEIPDFTIEESRDYLQRRGREWGTIPEDVRRTLRRPLLAALYCDLAAEQNWTPTTEYELFERYWKRLQHTPGRPQADFPGDIGRMRRLAATILQQDSTYPWTQTALKNADVDDEAQKRLEAIGWLRRLDDGRVEIWHERLLNWAVAEALIEQRQDNRISTTDLGAWLAKFQRYSERFAGRFLGYVPMDVLWLASDPQRGLSAQVSSQLIAAIERHREYAGYPDSLYKDLLPTLGKHILPALLERLQGSVEQIEEAQDPASQKFNPYPQLIATTLVRIAKKDPESVQRSAVQLLDESVPELQQTGMRVLARSPCATALDRLWELHKQHARLLKEGKDPERYFLYDLSFPALRSCVQLEPNWLVAQIHAVDRKTDPVWELAYLVANLEGSSAREIWTKVKPTLLENVPPDKSRSLVSCIRRYRDFEELSRLEGWLQEEKDFASDSAFATLAILDPDRALSHFYEISQRGLYLSRFWWLPELLLSRRTEIQAKIRALMQGPDAKPWEVANVYQGQENEIDEDTLDLLLDIFEGELETYSDQIKTAPSTTPWLFLRLEFLAYLSRFGLLQRFQMRAGSKLETLLITLACSWVWRSGRGSDEELHYAHLILLKIGGTGITALINHELGHANLLARLNGLRWALVKPDAETHQRLRNVAQTNQMAGDPPSRLEQIRATRALAALQETETVLESVRRWGLSQLPDLLEWWQGHGYVEDECLRKAISDLEDKDENTQSNAVLILAVSGRTDFAPRIRQILSTAPEGSNLALAAIIALDELNDKDPETVALLTHRLQVPRALDLLFHIGTERALDVLEQHVLTLDRAEGLVPIRDLGLQVALGLSKYPSKRHVAARVVWEAIKGKDPLPWPNECFEVIGGLDNREVQEWLQEEAFPSEGAMKNGGRIVSVIRGLAKLDPEAAFQAAELALRRTQGNRELIPDLLVELDQNRAISLLCGHAPAERHTLTRWAIGRALRHTSQPNLVRENLEEMLQNSDSASCRAAAELCGWQRSDFQEILRILYTDASDDKLRKAARKALERQRNEREVQQLMDAFRDAEGSERWSFMEAIIELGDPYLLGSRKDPLWLGQVLDDAPFAFVEYARGRLERHVEELRKKAEEEEWEVNQDE
jgi:hypothetical protein